jgi:hypothetical protein
MRVICVISLSRGARQKSHKQMSFLILLGFAVLVILAQDINATCGASCEPQTYGKQQMSTIDVVHFVNKLPHRCWLHKMWLDMCECKFL